MAKQEKSKGQLSLVQEQEISNLLLSYAKALTILNDYDNQKLKDVPGQKSELILDYQACQKVILQIKKELGAKNEAGDLFGVEREEGFLAIVNNLYQTFDQQELYPTIEDKASHLLYLIIKDHPFSDGNKRIAAFFFVYFLDRSDYLYCQSGERRIDNNTLIALVLLIAESRPKEKIVFIKIIKNLLVD